jgi:hypothetical protein
VGYNEYIRDLNGRGEDGWNVILVDEARVLDPLYTAAAP